MAWYQTIPDSDQSISDEEEPDQNWANKCATLGGTTEKKELLQISSRLEMLKGANAKACNLEDEVSSDYEVNNVVSKVSVNGSAKELRKKEDVHSFWSDKQDELHSWSAVSKEAEALMRLNEKTSCSLSLSAYSNLKKSSKGAKGKGKPKFLFRFPTHKEGTSSHSISKNDSDVSFRVQELPERLDAIEPRNVDHSDVELIEDIQGEEESEIVLRNEEHSDVELLEDISGEEESLLEVVPFEAKAIRHGCMGQSMAELLDGLQDKTTIWRKSSRKHSRKRRKKEQPVVKCASPLGDGTFDIESSPEHLGHGLPSDIKIDDQILKLADPEMKRQTLVDRFQEAMSDRFLVAVPKTLKSGLFGKLQQVVQSEKETDIEFLKKIQEGASENDPNCMDVKILSKYLDAKLTVCHCSFGNNSKRLPSPEVCEEMVDEGPERTIIFNPRVCNDIDLDIGKWIRIHPPWRDIRVGTAQNIILSTYFSEISM
ncbi:hypothetical protein RchiOBHm_Chr6g0293271 [Rosa chinensis]|uniref:Uncharacterized protein n=1 Tax=Rosa chinensis TaxID=74649 RepID=A0A2P6PWM6_ROSCH|nr:uncharacterized protein LOC112172730 isoform X2 [Rosa chinensis]PRQ26315.1 hypothetical protein RchiOBHm_Chr6g0293271 [Rosa chinensis]